MKMLTSMFNPVIAGLLMTSILAAIMSTASSQLLVTASSVSQDIFALWFKMDENNPRLVWVSRLTVSLVAVVAIIIALDPASSVFGLVSSAWGGFGAAFGPIILFSLFWRRMTRQGAIAGMLAGGISDIFWFLKSGGIFDIYEIIPGFLIGCAVLILVSLATKPTQDMMDEFDSVKTMQF